jgi:replication factor C subunit 3/5
MNINFLEDKPNLDDLDFKLDIIKPLKSVDIDELVNLLFYGVEGCGKTTKIYALLASIFDKRVYDLKNVNFEEDRKVISYKSSIYHIEINPVNLGSNEKLFIHSFIKSYTQTRNIGLNIPKIILIKNADKLSSQSQMALRKIIEKTTHTCKFIFEANNLSSLSEPLRSRFLLIRVPLPNKENIKLCIKNYSDRKNHNISSDIINEIIDESCIILNNYNLKKIFGFYRYYVVTKKKFKFLYYDNFNEIYNLINNKKISFITFQKIRDIVNEMYINLVSMNELLMFLYNKFITQFSNNNENIKKIVNITSKCDNNLKKGNKDCLHLELYIISIIELLH